MPSPILLFYTRKINSESLKRLSHIDLKVKIWTQIYLLVQLFFPVYHAARYIKKYYIKFLKLSY